MASQERWTAAAAEVLGTPVAAAVPLSRRRQGGGVLMLLGFVAFAVVVVLFVSGIVPGPRLLAYFLGALVMSVLIQLGQEPVFAAQTAHGIQMIGSSRWTPHPTGPVLGPLDPATVDGPARRLPQRLRHRWGPPPHLGDPARAVSGDAGPEGAVAGDRARPRPVRLTGRSHMSVDLNSDLGEGFGNWSLGDDDALLDVVTSANVACGFHASDASIMRRVCARAVESGVVIGAQVGYRDLPGFGRRFIDIEPDALTNDVIYQLGALEAFARAAGGRVGYVKPHGALYNAIVHHEEQAAAVVEAIVVHDRTLPVMGLPGSVWLRRAEQAGLTTVQEAFADRAYTPDGTLVSRRLEGAVLHDATAIAQRCVAMAAGEPIQDVEGGSITLRPDSICVHGDTPGAVEIARSVRDALEKAGVDVRPFVTSGAG